MKKTENQMLVIFGASGDLTARKLVPGLFNLFKEGHLPENFVVLGVSRSNMTDMEFRKKVVLESEHLNNSSTEDDLRLLDVFVKKFFYEDLGSTYDVDYNRLEKRISDLNSKYRTDSNYIFYLSTPPCLFEAIAKNLTDQGLNEESNGFKRLIVDINSYSDSTSISYFIETNFKIPINLACIDPRSDICPKGLTICGGRDKQAN